MEGEARGMELFVEVSRARTDCARGEEDVGKVEVCGAGRDTLGRVESIKPGVLIGLHAVRRILCVCERVDGGKGVLNDPECSCVT